MNEFLYILVNDSKAGKSQIITCSNHKEVKRKIDNIIDFIEGKKEYNILKKNKVRR